jgi:hypothetical protein
MRSLGIQALGDCASSNGFWGVAEMTLNFSMAEVFLRVVNTFEDGYNVLGRRILYLGLCQLSVSVCQNTSKFAFIY